MFIFIFIYLKGGKRGEKQIVYLLVYAPKCPRQPGLGPGKARKPEGNLGSKPLGHPLSLPRMHWQEAGAEAEQPELSASDRG